MLKDKDIVLGVSGGIAAYKAAELVRLLVRGKACVRVVMTRAACEFITPLTMQTLSGNPVHRELFSLNEISEINHIALAQGADLMVLAPATYNLIGKMAGGIADDLLTSLIAATTAPVLVCPAMNDKMWANPILQENIHKLKEQGCHILSPEWGDLACKTQGPGRLPDAARILSEIVGLLSPKPLRDKRVLISAGPTREALDDVRFLSNPSSGRMGYALAEAARDFGACVELVSGPTALSDPHGIETIRVESAREMRQALQERFSQADALIMSAAVADFRPKKAFGGKLPKGEWPGALELERNSDIVASLASEKGERLVVGFAAQVGEDLEAARRKLAEKGLDYIVVNDISDKNIGFGAEENQVSVLAGDGSSQQIPRAAKALVARAILEIVFQCPHSHTG